MLPRRSADTRVSLAAETPPARLRPVKNEDGGDLGEPDGGGDLSVILRQDAPSLPSALYPANGNMGLASWQWR